MLTYQRRFSVLYVDDLRNWIIEEADGSHYSTHLGCTKIYHDIREVLLWEGLKGDIEEFVTKCQNCQQVKIEHQKLGCLLHEIQVPTWKWEEINMDFVVGLARLENQHDSIWVVVDRLKKSLFYSYQVHILSGRLCKDLHI